MVQKTGSTSDPTNFFISGILLLVGPFLLCFKEITQNEKLVISLYADLLFKDFSSLSNIHKICIILLIVLDIVGIAFISISMIYE